MFVLIIPILILVHVSLVARHFVFDGSNVDTTNYISFLITNFKVSY